MDETKKFRGILKGFGIKKQGQNAEGKNWILYEYTFQVGDKEKTMSGFLPATELLGEAVDVEYKETPNPKNPASHYNNLTLIMKAGAVEAANAQYNVVGINEPIKPEPKYTENPAFYGMVMKLASDWALAHKEDESCNKIDHWFDKIWEYAIYKRKEKLNY